VHRRTVRQALASPTPPPRKQRTFQTPRLDAAKPLIDAMLRQDLDAPRKQRQTARRVLARLVDEHQLVEVCYSSVRDYVAKRRPEAAAEAAGPPSAASSRRRTCPVPKPRSISPICGSICAGCARRCSCSRCASHTVVVPCTKPLALRAKKRSSTAISTHLPSWVGCRSTRSGTITSNRRFNESCLGATGLSPIGGCCSVRTWDLMRSTASPASARGTKREGWKEKAAGFGARIPYPAAVFTNALPDQPGPTDFGDRGQDEQQDGNASRLWRRPYETTTHFALLVSECRRLSGDDHAAAGRWDRNRYPLPMMVATRSAAITPARAASPTWSAPS
jgi:hypothetical protein